MPLPLWLAACGPGPIVAGTAVGGVARAAVDQPAGLSLSVDLTASRSGRIT